MDYHDEALLALTQCDKLNEISWTKLSLYGSDFYF